MLMTVDSKKIEESMRIASEDVIALEPKLTEWDTVSDTSSWNTSIPAHSQIVGDGDCGETCANGAKAVLGALKTGLGSDGDLVHLFRELTEVIDGESGQARGDQAQFQFY
jgi:dihydroxyacetone kinase